jgi:hypothetical protein
MFPRESWRIVARVGSLADASSRKLEENSYDNR